MKRFDYVKLNYVDRRKLDIIMQEIEKLNVAKLSYSVQELQSLDVLKDSQSKSKRVLQDVNKFLNASTNFAQLERKKSWGQELLGEYLDEKKVHEDIEVDVSDLRGKVYTLADTSFKANKYTKWLCENAIDIIAHGNVKFIRLMKKAYRDAHTEKDKRTNIDARLEEISKTPEYEEWKRNCYVGDIEDDNIILRQLYNDMATIWDLEEVLYEIKSQSNKELVRCLIEDNYDEFKDWGFSKDDEGKWVLNFFPDDVVVRYAYHVPDLGKILNESLVRKVEGARKLRYEDKYTSTMTKNTRDRINGKFKEKFFSNKKEEIIRLLRQQFITKELYIRAKRMMLISDFKKIEEEFPELRQRCEELKELIAPQVSKEADRGVEEDNEEVEQSTEFEKNRREQIEQNLARHKTIFVQARK